MAEVGAFSDQAQVQEAAQGTNKQFSGTILYICSENTYIYPDPGLRIRIRMDPYYFWRLALDPDPHLCERPVPDPEKQNSGA